MANKKEILDKAGLTAYDSLIKGYIKTATGGLAFWKGTRAEYDKIGSKDGNTLYIITG